MKFLLRLLVVFLMGSAYAQSNLPACSSCNFHNCYGSWTSPEGHKYIGEWKDYKYSGQGAFTLPSGNKYVGEFKDHKYNGQGTYTFGSGPWSGDKFVGEFKDGERTGQGTYTFANGNKYVGEWKDDERNGQGTYTWPDGDKYVGEYKNDKRNGPGTFTFANGNKYVGEYKDNKYNGQGILYLANGSISQSGIWSDDKLVTPQYVDPNRFTRTAKGNSVPACPATGYFHNCLGIFTSANGNKYVGEYRDNKFNGQGTFTFASGNKYVGEFKDGDFNGQGTFTWTNGDNYFGEYKNDKRNGQGTLTFANGEKYVGEYVDGKRNGQGTYTYPDGAKYVGEYRDDKRNGQGTHTYASGNKYVGEFKDGDYNGQGILYLANGSISQSGIWSDDKLVTPQYVDPNRFTRIAKGNSLPACPETGYFDNCLGTYTYANGNKYVGQWKNDKRNGKGTYTFGSGPWSGDKYVGEFKDDKFNGQATYTFADGNKYVGEWKDDKFNGQGTFTFANGNEYVGDFKDGKYNGQGTYIFANGNKYVGEFKDDNYNGQGILYLANGSISQSGIWSDDKLVTSQYVDPDRFTRIAKGNSAPSAAEAQRLENERKAAQLEEDRKRLELEKRQIALERQRIESQKVQPQIAPDNRRRLALVIGNDNYSSMPVLTNAVNDSNSMNDALRQANFEVMHYKNLNKRGMEEALYNFTQKLGKDDVGMFYFAGHGAQANSKNFLIPVAENVKKSADVQFEGIDVNRVMAYLQDSKNSLNIVVLDACRSSLPERGGMSRGLTVTEAPQGSIVAYATAPGKAASDGDVGNSPFTKNLVRVMQRKGLKIEDVFKEVRVAVSRETNGEQVPQEVSQLVGDFYFRP